MEIFNLIVDRKVEVWRRDKVSIKAGSLEEAAQKALIHDYLVPEDSEYLYETECTMSPDQVFPYDQATIEVMDEDGKLLRDNCGYGSKQLREDN